MLKVAGSALIQLLAGISSLSAWVSAQTPGFRAEGPLAVSASSYPLAPPVTRGHRPTSGPAVVGTAGAPYTPSEAARLAEPYPKPGDYAKAVEANVQALIAARFITEADGQSLIAEARLAK